MKSWRPFLACIMAAFCLAAFASARSNLDPARNVPAGRLHIAGSSTMAPLVSAIAQRFHARYPQVEISVEAGGSGRGLADARAGRADIGMVSRALGEADRDLYGLPIARDGVAVVIHASNQLRSLTPRQVADIFTGKIRDWKQVGGQAMPITVIQSEEKRSSTELFMQYYHLRFADLKGKVTAGDNAERIRMMLRHPGAILYMSVGEAERTALTGAPLKLLPIDGSSASSQSIRHGDYPIARPLTLVTRGAPSGLARLFIEYAASSQVSDLILAHDFVPYLD